LLSRRKEIVRDTPNFNQKEFLFHLSRAQYEKKWGRGYRKPGFGARILAFFLKIVPKVGPFKAVDFKIPTTQTEDMYIKSVNATVDDYQAVLRREERKQLELTNLDLDTGRETRAGEYALADDTYARLLHDVAHRDLNQVPPDLRANVLNFYSGMNQPIATRKDKKAWRTTQADLDKLRAQESNTAISDAPEGARTVQPPAVKTY